MKRKVVFPDSIFKSSTGCHDPFNTASNAVLKHKLEEANYSIESIDINEREHEVMEICSN